MATWNMFSDEVQQERTLGPARPYPSNYKAQALRELARRLNLEAELQDMRHELNKAIDRFELAECERDIMKMEKQES